MPIAPGTRIGPYEVVALLGTGGMGEVYRARDPRLGREVAIKVLPEATRASPERADRFEREARLLASINHPNIATIHGLEDLDGSSAIVMELVDGPSLAELISRGPLSLAEAALELVGDNALIYQGLGEAYFQYVNIGAAVGAKDEALHWLDCAIEQGMINYPFLSQHDWHLNSIRRDPRFHQAMDHARREWERFEV
jgi:hypothetical protein